MRYHHAQTLCPSEYFQPTQPEQRSPELGSETPSRDTSRILNALRSCQPACRVESVMTCLSRSTRSDHHRSNSVTRAHSSYSSNAGGEDVVIQQQRDLSITAVWIFNDRLRPASFIAREHPLTDHHTSHTQSNPSTSNRISHRPFCCSIFVTDRTTCCSTRRTT